MQELNLFCEQCKKFCRCYIKKEYLSLEYGEDFLEFAVCKNCKYRNEITDKISENLSKLSKIMNECDNEKLMIEYMKIKKSFE